MKTALDLEYKKDLYVDLFLPESEEFDLFIYIHGGGLAELSRKNVDVFAKTLAEKNIATASVEYSMYPKAKFPDFIEDCAEAIKWLRDNISNYGKCRRITIGGSSAGGYLSMMLCFNDKYLNAVGMKPTDIFAYVHDAGQPTAHFNVLKERGIDSKRIIVDETAPVYFIGLREEYSPMLFIVSDNDMFGRYEQTMMTIRALEDFGHKDKISFELINGSHCDYVYKADDEGRGKFANIILPFFEKLGMGR